VRILFGKKKYYVWGKYTRNYIQYFLNLVLFIFSTYRILRCLVFIVVRCLVFIVCSCLVFIVVVVLCVLLSSYVYCCTMCVLLFLL